MTDPELAEAMYIEPITAEFVERIIAKERPDATSIPEVPGDSIDYFNPFEVSSRMTTLEKRVARPLPVIDYKSKWSAELTGSKLLELISNI